MRVGAGVSTTRSAAGAGLANIARLNVRERAAARIMRVLPVASLGCCRFCGWGDALRQFVAWIDAQRSEDDNRTQGEADGQRAEEIGFEQAHDKAISSTAESPVNVSRLTCRYSLTVQ
jgi:hypothetical protein